MVDTVVARVTAVDLDDADEVHTLVGEWGLFGATARRAERRSMTTLRWDSVSLTRRELREFRLLARWLAAMKAGRWRSKDVPDYDALQVLVDWIPYPKRKTRLVYWEAFALALNQKIRPVLPMFGQSDRGIPRTLMFSATLLDAMYLRLGDQMSTKAQTARLCLGCRGVFFVSVGNDKRIYCSTRCKNRVNVARHRRKMRQKSDTRDGGQV
ncbi:MAG: CGNR zinc finger domain-containing protein [Chloroflexi bacterium]|nr:CGNR zinc finger domain-containing protein [Chloroflexota bacterium]